MDQHSSPRPSGQSRFCTKCGQPVDADWDFCANCGAPVRQGTSSPATPRPEPAPPKQTIAVDPDDTEIVYPHGYSPEKANADTEHRRKRRKRRHRRFWRRKRVIIPLAFLLVIVLMTGGAAYRASRVISSVQHISTPPPVVTDSTFMLPDDPDLIASPIVVETGPAQAALAEAAASRELPAPSDQGLGTRIKGVSGSIGDFANAASVASGLHDRPQEEGTTILVMGVDAQPGAAIDIGVRPDVLMLVRFDPQTHTCRMLSIPRDTRVELPGYGQSKINHALMVGGIPYQLMVTEDVMGISIDHYLLIDFTAFEQAVDVVGGVQVDIDKDLSKDGALQYAKGTYTMNGPEALALARFRTPTDGGDNGRVQRQWALLGGLADAAQGRDLITDVNTLVPTVENHIRTDLSLTDMATYAKDYGDNCLNINRDNIEMVNGVRVRFEDPILDMRLYYNVVTQSTIDQRVATLLGVPTAASSDTSITTPAVATPVASPVASPIATPESSPQTRHRKDRT